MAIIERDDQRTIAQLLRTWNLGVPAGAPFVRIGRLLLAVDQTGVEAWQPLINQLKAQYSANRFSLHSGRHGALEGCFRDDGLVPLGAAAPLFRDEDVCESAEFSLRAGVEIKVVDTGALPKEAYKEGVLADLALGDWVIVSWCHSIASMATQPNNPTGGLLEGGDLWISAQNESRRRIADVVREDYSWVPPD